MFNRKLAGDDGRVNAMAVVEHLQQVAPVRVIEHCKPPIVDHEHVYFGQLPEQFPYNGRRRGRWPTRRSSAADARNRNCSLGDRPSAPARTPARSSQLRSRRSAATSSRVAGSQFIASAPAAGCHRQQGAAQILAFVAAPYLADGGLPASCRSGSRVPCRFSVPAGPVFTHEPRRGRDRVRNEDHPRSARSAGRKTAKFDAVMPAADLATRSSNEDA